MGLSKTRNHTKQYAICLIPFQIWKIYVYIIVGYIISKVFQSEVEGSTPGSFGCNTKHHDVVVTLANHTGRSVTALFLSPKVSHFWVPPGRWATALSRTETSYLWLPIGSAIWLPDLYCSRGSVRPLPMANPFRGIFSPSPAWSIDWSPSPKKRWVAAALLPLQMR